MTRATTKGGRTFGPMTFVSFLIGVGIGLGLVAPVLPETVDTTIGTVVRTGGAVIIAGMLSLAVLMVVLAVMYQAYLKA